MLEYTVRPSPSSRAFASISDQMGLLSMTLRAGHENNNLRFAHDIIASLARSSSSGALVGVKALTPCIGSELLVVGRNIQSVLDGAISELNKRVWSGARVVYQHLPNHNTDHDREAGGSLRVEHRAPATGRPRTPPVAAMVPEEHFCVEWTFTPSEPAVRNARMFPVEAEQYHPGRFSAGAVLIDWRGTNPSLFANGVELTDKRTISRPVLAALILWFVTSGASNLDTSSAKLQIANCTRRPPGWEPTKLGRGYDSSANL
ncbi:MAG: hypothetical protein ACOYN0_18785, partial [Phycisphaerales bacterium]